LGPFRWIGVKLQFVHRRRLSPAIVSHMHRPVKPQLENLKLQYRSRATGFCLAAIGRWARGGTVAKQKAAL
jgi:hypothetical protein